MQLIPATATHSPQEFPPRQAGQVSRLLAEFNTDQNEIVRVWGPSSFLALRYLKPGQRVYLALDSQGKYHLIEDATPDQQNDPVISDRQTRQNLARLIRQQTSIYEFAHLNVSLQMGHKLAAAEVTTVAGQIVAQSLNWVKSSS